MNLILTYFLIEIIENVLNTDSNNVTAIDEPVKLDSEEIKNEEKVEEKPKTESITTTFYKPSYKTFKDELDHWTPPSMSYGAKLAPRHRYHVDDELMSYLSPHYSINKKERPASKRRDKIDALKSALRNSVKLRVKEKPTNKDAYQSPSQNRLYLKSRHHVF